MWLPQFPYPAQSAGLAVGAIFQVRQMRIQIQKSSHLPNKRFSKDIRSQNQPLKETLINSMLSLKKIQPYGRCRIALNSPRVWKANQKYAQQIPGITDYNNSVKNTGGADNTDRYCYFYRHHGRCQYYLFWYSHQLRGFCRHYGYFRLTDNRRTYFCISRAYTMLYRYWTKYP